MTDLRFGRATVRAIFSASSAALILLLGGVASGDDARSRYIEASVAMQCSARDADTGADLARREAANDKILRGYGFTRKSFAAAGFEFSADAKAQADIARLAGVCKTKSPGGRFTGTFKDGQLAGRVDVTFRPGGVRGSVRATYKGRSISIPIRNQNLKAGRIQAGGNARNASYALVMSHEGNRLDALLVVDGGTGPERIEFQVLRK